ncbi:MAG: hypothetical protein DCC75_11830 [Proteobacteria bacterium]|nr:MAG: hypothetical protein DCC75_11830 [Pseudomonadota bacterium]
MSAVRRAVSKVDHYLWRILTWAAGSQLSPAGAIVKLCLILTLVMVLGTIVGWRILGTKIGWLFGEGDLMTWVSTLALLACGSIAFRIWQARRAQSAEEDRRNKTIVWRYLGFGFFFLAADELLRIHESFDRQLHKLLGVRPTDFTDHLDDLIVMLYGVAGLYLLIWGISEIKRYLSVKFLLLGAALFGTLTVTLDFLASAKWLWKTQFEDLPTVQFTIDLIDVMEEMCKIYSEIFFVGAMLACLRIAQSIGSRAN